MNTTPKFLPSLWGSLQSNMDTAKWPAVSEAWEKGQHRTSFLNLLDYINPLLRTTYGNSAQNMFEVPHGSVVVNISIRDEHAEITSEFINIAESPRVPLLRRIAELNFYPLTLPQIQLSGDKLRFYYRCSMDTCEPYKMFYVLKEICKTADTYDDDFREKFQTKNIIEPKVTYCNEKEAQQAWTSAQEIISETLAFANHFDSQRWHNQTCDILSIGLKRIDYVIQPQGSLKNEIERVHTSMTDPKASLLDRNNAARNFFSKLHSLPKDDFAKSLYKAQVFVPEKWNASLSTAQTALNGFALRAQQFLQEKNYLMASLETLFAFYSLYFNNYVDKAVSDDINGALAATSQKRWEDAAPVLVNTIVKYKAPAQQQ